MTGAEKIQGKKLFRLIERLQKEKIMLSMRLVGRNYQRLTMVTHISHDKDRSFFTIDPPRDFRNTIAQLDTWEIKFNFKGLDNLEYIFTTTGGTFSDDQPRIPFPKYIERLQRRKHFRMSVPVGTKLYVELEKIRREIDLINISMRGALGVLSTSKGKAILRKEDNIKNIEIVFPSDEKGIEQTLQVKKAIIRRSDHNPDKKIEIYAFEFESIDRDQEKILIETIYNLQRLFLRTK